MLNKGSRTVNVVLRDLEDIVPYWRNPRFIIGAVEAVKKSIERYGFVVPIIVDSEGVIVAGHVRYKAAVELGLEQVPCIEFEGSETKAREFRIADNVLRDMAVWDLDKLDFKLQECGGEVFGCFSEVFEKSMGLDLDDSGKIMPGKVNKSDAGSGEVSKGIIPVCPSCGVEVRKEWLYGGGVSK